MFRDLAGDIENTIENLFTTSENPDLIFVVATTAAMHRHSLLPLKPTEHKWRKVKTRERIIA